MECQSVSSTFFTALFILRLTYRDYHVSEKLYPIDKRITLGNLKEILQSEVGCSPEYFRVRLKIVLWFSFFCRCGKWSDDDVTVIRNILEVSMS